MVCFSVADQRHCVTLATTGGESSNTELLTCLEMARDVRVLRSATAAASERETTEPAPSPSVPTVHPATTEPILEANSDKEALKMEDIEAKKGKSSEQNLRLRLQKHRKPWHNVNSPMQKRP